MNFLLISGPKDSGKSTLIKNLYQYYLANGYTSIYHKRYVNDFTAVIEKNGRQIVIQSDTDLPGCILRLKAYIAKNPLADVVITACRHDPDAMRRRLFHELSIGASGNPFAEVPLGRMPSGGSRGVSIAWYAPQMQNIAIMIGGSAPFYL